MHTLGNKTTKVVHKEESWSINDSYVCKVAVPVGTIVKLDSATGEVEPVSAVADIPFGVVSVGCTKENELVTVQTQFNTILKGKASGAITSGDYLQAESLDTTAGLVKYKKAVAGGTACAVALADAGNDEDFTAGVLRVFVKL